MGNYEANNLDYVTVKYMSGTDNKQETAESPVNNT